MKNFDKRLEREIQKRADDRISRYNMNAETKVSILFRVGQ